jgi:hypothetical protein
MHVNPIDNFTPDTEEALHQQHAEYRRRSSTRLHNQRRRHGADDNAVRRVARWRHHVPADLRCAVAPLPWASAQADAALRRGLIDTGMPEEEAMALLGELERMLQA